MNIESVIRSGEDFERLVLGFSHQDIHHIFNRAKDKRDFNQCILEAKQLPTIYGTDPKKPKTKILRALFQNIQSNMKSYQKDLRVFPCVGTVLDSNFGIDLFFECQGKIASVDLTIKRGKVNPKADVVITLEDLKLNHHYARCSRIAQILLSKLAQKKQY